MNITEHFTLEEMTFSDTAERKGINNSIPSNLRSNIKLTCEKMELIRKALGNKSITVTSGFRSQALNTAIGGVSKSDHMLALAVDFKCPEVGTPFEICKILEPIREQLGIKQLIYEYGRWVHVGFNPVEKEPINRVLTYKLINGQVKAIPGIQQI